MAAWISGNAELALKFFNKEPDAEIDENFLAENGVTDLDVKLIKDLIKLKTLK